MENISASIQDYLEAVFDLSQEDENVRSVDIAARLNVSRASVSRAAGVMRELEYIEQERYGELRLTKKGKQAAMQVRETHNVLRDFLAEKLGVSLQVAEQDACKMEHAISRETLVKLKKFMEK